VHHTGVLALGAQTISLCFECQFEPRAIVESHGGGYADSATTFNGRFSIMMPYHEREFRTVQNSRHPGWRENASWMRLFQNAGKRVD